MIVTPHHRPLVVLHIDDDEVDQVYVNRCLLKGPGAVEIQQAASLEAAQARLAEATVDVVLLDLQLKGHSGLATLAAFLSFGHAIPVVVLTGNDDPALGLQAIQSGAEDYVLKDRLEPVTLWNTLAFAVARSNTRIGDLPGRTPDPLQPATPADALLQPGDVVDRYVVEREIGRGGAGVVYRVRHQTLDTVLALKVVSLPEGTDPARTLREGKLQARLAHPNLVRAIDLLQLRPRQLGIVMDHVAGPNLHQWLKRRSVPAAVWMPLFRSVVEAVGHAHEAGLVHRDLKPSNVLLDQRNEQVVPRVTDFGIAKLLRQSDHGDLTVDGASVGTPGYMAPEQIDDASSVDHRADLFSLGCILYLLACSRPAFDGPSAMSKLVANANTDYPDPRAASGSPQVSAILRNLLQHDPEHRTADCPTLLSELSALDTSTLRSCDLHGGTRTETGQSLDTLA